MRIGSPQAAGEEVTEGPCPAGWPLFLRSNQCTCRSGSCVQIERSACDEEVQPQTEHANGLSVGDNVNGGETDIRAVNDGDAAAAFDLQGVVRTDERSGVFVQ